MGFGAEGFMEVQPIDLTPHRSLVVSFQTRSANAIILVGVDRKELKREKNLKRRELKREKKKRRNRRRPIIRKRHPYTREVRFWVIHELLGKDLVIRYFMYTIPFY